MSFVEMLRQLDTAGVRFVVVGGIAGQLHGSTRLTNDLDVVYDTASDNLSRLAPVLRGWDAYLRDVDPGLPFEIDARTLRASTILNLTTRLGNIDVLQTVSGLGDYADALERSEVFDFDGVAVRSLTRGRPAAGRSADTPGHRVRCASATAPRVSTMSRSGRTCTPTGGRPVGHGPARQLIS